MTVKSVQTRTNLAELANKLVGERPISSRHLPIGSCYEKGGLGAHLISRDALTRAETGELPYNSPRLAEVMHGLSEYFRTGTAPARSLLRLTPCVLASDSLRPSPLRRRPGAHQGHRRAKGRQARRRAFRLDRRRALRPWRRPEARRGALPASFLSGDFFRPRTTDARAVPCAICVTRYYPCAQASR